MTDINKYKNQVISLINRGSWQHSWHLKKDEGGYPDWHNPDNYKTLSDLIFDAECKASQLMEKAKEAQTALEILIAYYDPFEKNS